MRWGRGQAPWWRTHPDSAHWWKRTSSSARTPWTECACWSMSCPSQWLQIRCGLRLTDYSSILSSAHPDELSSLTGINYITTIPHNNLYVLMLQAVAAAKKEKRALSSEEKALVDRVIVAANTIVQVRGCTFWPVAPALPLFCSKIIFHIVTCHHISAYSTLFLKRNRLMSSRNSDTRPIRTSPTSDPPSGKQNSLTCTRPSPSRNKIDAYRNKCHCQHGLFHEDRRRVMDWSLECEGRWYCMSC